MSYNKKVWKSGDRITKEALNNMENGIEAAHQNSGGSGTSYDDTAIRNDITGIKTDLGTEELTTTAKDVKGAVNEVAAQCKDIANKTIIEGNKIYLAKADGTKLDDGTALPSVSQDIKLMNHEILGELFNSPSGYTSHMFNAFDYDEVNNTIPMIINRKYSHYKNEYACLGFLNPFTLELEGEFTPIVAYDSNSENPINLISTIANLVVENGVYYTYQYINGHQYRFKTTNKGVNWTYEQCTVSNYTDHFQRIFKINNRYFTSAFGDNFGGIIIYSDDGLKWTSIKIDRTNINNKNPFECDFIDLEDNKIICIGRYTMSGADSSKVKQIEPAVISYSTDNGVTWSAWQLSTSIKQMNADNCCHYIDDDGIIHLWVLDRYPTNGKTGAIYYYTATKEQALNDNFSLIEPIAYGSRKTYTNKASEYEDWGAIGCRKILNYILIAYYDQYDSDKYPNNFGVSLRFIKASLGNSNNSNGKDKDELDDKIEILENIAKIEYNDLEETLDDTIYSKVFIAQNETEDLVSGNIDFAKYVTSTSTNIKYSTKLNKRCYMLRDGIIDIPLTKNNFIFEIKTYIEDNIGGNENKLIAIQGNETFGLKNVYVNVNNTYCFLHQNWNTNAWRTYGFTSIKNDKYHTWKIQSINGVKRIYYDNMEIDGIPWSTDYVSDGTSHIIYKVGIEYIKSIKFVEWEGAKPTKIIDNTTYSYTMQKNGSDLKLYKGDNLVSTVDISATEKSWKKIKTITTTEEQTSILINVDEDGNAFSVKELLVYGKIQGTATNKMASNVRLELNSKYSNSFYISSALTNNGDYYKFQAEIKISPVPRCSWNCGKNSENSVFATSNGGGLLADISLEEITSLTVIGNNESYKFGIGTEIIVWGR